MITDSRNPLFSGGRSETDPTLPDETGIKWRENMKELIGAFAAVICLAKVLVITINILPIAW